VTALPSLLVVGAGGLAREVVQAVHAVNAVAPTYDLLGHLDDDTTKRGRLVDGVPVLGPVEAVHDDPQALVVIATGRPTDPGSRLRLARRLGLPAHRQPAIVHPAASIAASVSVGAGSIVLAGAVATAAVSIGRHVVVMPACVLTHDCVLADHSTLAAGVLLAGGVRVEEGAYLGAGARVRENLTIGAWSLVGMGSLVTRSVPAEEVWFGAPARNRPDTAAPGHPFTRGAGA
jgi:sugar O-acyltransferase (sialic acid O-acetyltransferase NeuD family)